MTNTMVLVLGGAPPGPMAAQEVPTDAYVIAVDSGLDHAVAMGLSVDMLIGDMDSVDPDLLRAFSPERRIVHPIAKDRTDLELALDCVKDNRQYHEILVVGGAGGRLDHLMGNATVLCSDRYAHLDIDWISAAGRAHVVWVGIQIHGVPGRQVSLIPMGGDAEGVTTSGLRWELEHATLGFGSSRGISNQMTAPIADVVLESGVLLVVQPDFA